MVRTVLLLACVSSAISALGQTTWRRTYGGHAVDNASAVKHVDGGGYFVLGTTGSFGYGASDIYALWLDEFGGPIWTNVYGGLGTDVGTDCAVLNDGFVLAGYTSLGSIGGYDVKIIRIDNDGGIIWDTTTGTTEWDLGYAVDVKDETIFVSGVTYGHGCLSGCAFVTKLDIDGGEIWTYSHSVGAFSNAIGVVTMEDGGVVFCGSVDNGNGNLDGLLVRLGPDGELVWQETFGGVDDEVLSDVILTSSNSVVAAGESNSLSEYARAWLVSLNQAGEEEWQRDFGAGTADAGASGLVERNEGGFAVTGFNTLNFGNRDMILAILDQDGWFGFGFNYGNGEPADGYAVDITDDGGYVVAGWAENYGPGIRAAYVVKTDSAVLTESLDVDPFLDPVSVPSHYRQPFNLYPNPVVSEGVLNISSPQQELVRSITLTDLSGRVIVQQDCFACTSFKLPSVSHGVYNLIIETDGGVRSVHPLIIN